MTSVSLSDAKSRLASILRDLGQLGEPVVITRSGRPAGVLLSVDEYEGLLETLEILADDELRSALEAGLDDLENGRVVEHEELWSEMEAPLRR